jgi:predicted DNA binding CopG/RHH family protein
METKPVRSETTTAEEWVTGGQKMKRLTIDVPEDLHRRIKMGCAARGAKMADEIRELLDKEFEMMKA